MFRNSPFFYQFESDKPLKDASDLIIAQTPWVTADYQQLKSILDKYNARLILDKDGLVRIVYDKEVEEDLNKELLSIGCISSNEMLKYIKL